MWRTNVKQINIQSDLTSLSSWLIFPHSQILSLHHFNLRSFHFQSSQSVSNWIQLATSETSPVRTSFQWTNNKNMLSAIKVAFSAIKIAFSISERVLLENFTGVFHIPWKLASFSWWVAVLVVLHIFPITLSTVHSLVFGTVLFQ